MQWIYLSPHLDDAVYSCGGRIWEQTQAGQRVEIWTVCAGGPPPGPLTPFAEMLHARWGTGPQATRARRDEDQRACREVGAIPRYLDVPDVIYRRLPDGRPVVEKEEDLRNPLHPAEIELAEQLGQSLAAEIPSGAWLVAPLGLGSHTDHQLTAALAAWLADHGWRDQMLYYADFPYAVRCPADVQAARQAGFSPQPGTISPGGVRAWQRAVAAHASQISTFWEDLPAMERAIAGYAESGAGGLWERNL